MPRETIIKTCKKHGQTKFRAMGRGKHERFRCKICSSEQVQRRRQKLKKLAVDYKGGKCQLCGYDRCLRALDFHHVDSTKKDFGVSMCGQTRSWKNVKKEIDKCILVCANCHREIHAGVITIP